MCPATPRPGAPAVRYRAPAKLPQPVTDKLNGELIRVLRSPAMRERISAQFFDVYSTPAEFQKVIESDYAKWGKIVRASGARVD